MSDNGMLFAEVIGIYQGSSGDATVALYKRLELCGPMGQIAVNLFRAHKNSGRAKVYRGGNGQGSFKGMAYERKEWAIGNLAKILDEHAQACGLRWGWGLDRTQEYHNIVLYVDLPTGQVSFHTARRGAGPEYNGQWDGARETGAARICQWCAALLSRVEA